MNYNNYDSNGNEKKFNIDLSDKKQKSRAILGVYAVIFIILIIIIRTSGIAKNYRNNNETNTNENVVNPNPIDDEKFSFVNENNYEFEITLKYDNTEYVSTGKRYNDKFDFNYAYNGESYRFFGTLNSIVTYDNESSSYQTVHLPYFYINYYDIDELRSIVEYATLVDDTYVISDEKLSSITGISLVSSNSGMNYIKLIKKNNKIVGMEIDISSVVTNSTNKESVVKINIEYKNFGLVDDFDIDFE